MHLWNQAYKIIETFLLFLIQSAVLKKYPINSISEHSVAAKLHSELIRLVIVESITTTDVLVIIKQ